jgi:hypothetical protein
VGEAVILTAPPGAFSSKLFSCERTAEIFGPPSSRAPNALPSLLFMSATSLSMSKAPSVRYAAALEASVTVLDSPFRLTVKDCPSIFGRLLSLTVIVIGPADA